MQEKHGTRTIHVGPLQEQQVNFTVLCDRNFGDCLTEELAYLDLHKILDLEIECCHLKKKNNNPSRIHDIGLAVQ